VWLSQADSEEELRQRLENKGYQIDDIQAYNFDEWLRRAEEETEKIKAAEGDDRYSFKQSIWNLLKLHLFEQYFEKCAYCESKVLTVSLGDVEHYRPKKRVSEDPDHPGYYWLAYDHNNMLPSCERCNRYYGKRNVFPIAGKRAFKPDDDINCEGPLLINPTTETNPDQHLAFDPGIFDENLISTCTGKVIGLSVAGNKSIETYKLNRAYLSEARKAEQEHCLLAFKMIMLGNGTTDHNKYLEKIKSGDNPYSAAVLAHLKQWIKEIQKIAI